MCAQTHGAEMLPLQQVGEFCRSSLERRLGLGRLKRAGWQNKGLSSASHLEQNTTWSNRMLTKEQQQQPDSYVSSL